MQHLNFDWFHWEPSYKGFWSQEKKYLAYLFLLGNLHLQRVICTRPVLCCLYLWDGQQFLILYLFHALYCGCFHAIHLFDLDLYLYFDHFFHDHDPSLFQIDHGQLFLSHHDDDRTCDLWTPNAQLSCDLWALYVLYDLLFLFLNDSMQLSWKPWTQAFDGNYSTDCTESL